MSLITHDIHKFIFPSTNQHFLSKILNLDPTTSNKQKTSQNKIIFKLPAYARVCKTFRTHQHQLPKVNRNDSTKPDTFD